MGQRGFGIVNHRSHVTCTARELVSSAFFLPYYQYQSVRQKADLSRMKIDQECEFRKERFYLDLHKSYFLAVLETCDGDSKMAREIADAKLEEYKRASPSWTCAIM